MRVYFEKCDRYDFLQLTNPPAARPWYVLSSNKSWRAQTRDTSSTGHSNLNKTLLRTHPKGLVSLSRVLEDPSPCPWVIAVLGLLGLVRDGLVRYS
jgi:hypothetical protein